ncbi:MAG: helix-turn-helix transcriptional regulator [Telmatospirillum sp.]|nr:helix-turn-helix transcriptional regulator [Telmatospirillum sp.]
MTGFSGADIFEWRKLNNLTQKQAAAILKVAVVTVQFWEIGKRTPPAHLGLLIERLGPEDYPKNPGSRGKRPAARNTSRSKADNGSLSPTRKK